MFRKFIMTGLCLLATGSLFLAACNGAQPPSNQPTVNANTIYTQAAQTVQAQMNANATQAPAATSTNAPTPTLRPTSTIALSSTPATSGTPGATPTGGGANPTATATKSSANGNPPKTSGDKCDWVDQSPKDGTQITKNSSWDMTIIVKNSGTTTWTKQYALRFWGGDKLGSPNDYLLQNEVKPGDVYKFVFSMSAPDSTGKKQANWVIQTGEGLNFCPVFLQIEVVD